MPCDENRSAQFGRGGVAGPFVVDGMEGGQVLAAVAAGEVAHRQAMAAQTARRANSRRGSGKFAASSRGTSNRETSCEAHR